MDRLAGPGPSPEATAEALDGVLHDDVQHAARILGAIVAIAAGREGQGAREAPDAVLVTALDDELVLVRERVVAGRMARYGRERLGPAIVGVTAGEPSAALAAEALDVGVGPAESRLVVALLDPRLPPAERLARLVPPGGITAGRRDVEDWLRDLVEDADHGWRSTWLRACAIQAAGARGLLERIDLASARALGDPVVDEELGRAAGGVPDGGGASS
jgi:hypothetical protein